MTKVKNILQWSWVLDNSTNPQLLAFRQLLFNGCSKYLDKVLNNKAYAITHVRGAQCLEQTHTLGIQQPVRETQGSSPPLLRACPDSSFLQS